MTENEKKFTAEGREVGYDEEGRAYVQTSPAGGGIRSYLDESEYPRQKGASAPLAQPAQPPIDMAPIIPPRHAAAASTEIDQVNAARVAAQAAKEAAEKQPVQETTAPAPADNTMQPTQDAAAEWGKHLPAVDPGAPTSATGGGQ